MKTLPAKASLHTDESRLYTGSDKHFAEHETVHHSSDEYVRFKFTWGKDGPKTEKVHTNSAEGYFSIFKRGMRGFINIAAKSICIGIWRNTTSAIITAIKLGFNDGDRAALAL